MLKLTNATPEFKDKPLLINPRHILTMFETTQKIGDEAEITVTNIYTVTQQSWVVTESLDDIYYLLEGVTHE